MKEQKRIKAVRVYFTESEFEDLKQKAKAKEMTLAKYVRLHHISVK